jgi:hypothetical protein
MDLSRDTVRYLGQLEEKEKREGKQATLDIDIEIDAYYLTITAIIEFPKIAEVMGIYHPRRALK